MTAQQINGYSHALFTGGSYLHRYATFVDKTENGGNNNGVIDGKEIEAFKKHTQKQTGYNFDFTNLKQVQNKTIDTYKDSKPLFKTTTEVAQHYGGPVTTQTIHWMNLRNRIIPSKPTLDIPYMTDEDFKSSKKSVQEQENTVKKMVEAQNEKIEAKEKAEFKENTESTFQKICQALFGWMF